MPTGAKTDIGKILKPKKYRLKFFILSLDKNDIL
tara:strand:- start:447 stop:548 length:102 start_codon:yes stop_codon:yes gene_type:complete